MVNKPYYIIEKEETLNWMKEIRVFENYKKEDLFWHRDEEDRSIELIEGNCQIQFDNELPKELQGIIDIPKMVYHRIIAENEEKIVLAVYKY